MSLKALGQKEAEMANQGKSKNAANEAYDSGDEEVISKKKGKRNKKGGQQQEDEEFLDNDAKLKEAEADGEKKTKDDGSADEQDIQNQLDDHFEGVGKKNTRRKKNKDSAYAAQNAGADAMMAAAFDEGADSDEVHARKGGKNNKKDKKEHQGKKKNKNKNQNVSDDEEKEEAKVVEEEKEEPEQTTKAGGLPLEVIYCKRKYLVVFNSFCSNLSIGCGLPPEYCSFGQKDISACKEWLRDAHPDLFAELYPGEETNEDAGTQEEQKGDAGDDDQIEEKPKEKKKVKFGKADAGKITVTKLHRGGKKVIT